MLAALLLGAGAAYADPVEASTSRWLEWLPDRAAGTCPDAEVFAAKVESHLGRSPAQAAAESRRRLVARIERAASDPSRWSADVEVLDPSGAVVGSRTLAKTSESCGPVVDALALVAALVLSQQALAEPEAKPNVPPVALPPSSLESAPSVATTVVAPVLAPKAPAGAPERMRGWAFALEGGPLFGIGILPGLNLGGELRLLAAPPAGPAFYTRVALWPAKKASISENRGATLDLWTAGLGVCPIYAHSPLWTLGLCAGGDAGRLHARGFGFATQTSGQQWLVELSAGGHVQRKLARGYSVAIGLDFAVPLTNGRVAYAGTTGQPIEVWHRWPVAAVASARLGYAFW